MEKKEEKRRTVGEKNKDDAVETAITNLLYNYYYPPFDITSLPRSHTIKDQDNICQIIGTTFNTKLTTNIAYVT